MLSSTIIRKATSTDAQAISKLMIPLVTEFISCEYTEQGAAVMLASMTPKVIRSNFDQAYEYFVTEENNEIVAVLGIKQGNHIFHCFVDKNHHRIHFGKNLWQYWLANAKPERVTVNSSRYAIKFYQSLGFSSNHDIFEKNGVTCYPMVFENH